MKKLIYPVALLLCVSNLFAQGTGKIQWGLSLSTTNNVSNFKGGNSNAHARFHHNDYKGGEWQITARKDLSEHIFVQTGIGASELGFSTALTNNYSLLNKTGHYVGVDHKWVEGFIPVMGYYKSNLNCRNWRWVAGGGLSYAWHTNLQTFSNVSETTNENVNAKTSEALTQTSNAKKYSTVKGLISVGMEKQFKKNQILGLYLFGNIGTTPVANSFVEYTLDNQLYKHQFSNKGSYWGLRLSYYFRTKVQ